MLGHTTTHATKRTAVNSCVIERERTAAEQDCDITIHAAIIWHATAGERATMTWWSRNAEQCRAAKGAAVTTGHERTKGRAHALKLREAVAARAAT